MIKILKKSVMVVAVSLFCMSCHANIKNDFKNKFEQEGKTGYKQVLTDSVADIVLEAKKITVSLVGKSTIDSLRQDSVCVLSQKMVSVMQYLLFDPNNFKTDYIVYGHFKPWVSIEIISKKKRKVNIELDFGLSKWRMVDAAGKLLTQKDMQSNNIQFVRFVRMLFPDDKTLCLLNQNFTIKK